MQQKNVYVFSLDPNVRLYWKGLGNKEWNTVPVSSVTELLDLEEQQLVVIDIDSLTELTSSVLSSLFTRQWCVVASLNPTDSEGLYWINQGAKGYVHAYSVLALWHQVFTQIQAGRVWLGSSLLSRLLSQLSQNLEIKSAWKKDLTTREVEVAELVALGHSNQQVAAYLGITQRTVRAHLASVFVKLEVSDRLMLALRVHGVGEEAEGIGFSANSISV